MSYADDYLTIKEVDRLINNISQISRVSRTGIPQDTIQLFFKIIYHGMLRIQEATHLKKCDFNFTEKKITLREPRTGWETCSCHGDAKCPKCKGKGKLRVPQIAVFSSPKVWSEIQHKLRNLGSNEFLFPNIKFDKQVSRHAAFDWIKKLSENLEIKKNVHPTILRDSRAHHLRMTKVLIESQIHQMYRGQKNQLSGAYVHETPEKLIVLDEKANTFLKTYCEDCSYKNPDEGLFCCMCGNSLKENKSILD